MDFKHVPVLYQECMDSLNIRPDGIYVDGTLGGGGHASGIGSRLNEKGTLIGIDRDTDALDAAGRRLEGLRCRTELVHNTYANIKEVLSELNISGINGALLDIGVSSFQLDNKDRGFSYMHDAPLDMRMNREDSFSAYDVVNRYDKKQLQEVIKKYGEEKWASRISDFIVKNRQTAPIETTGQLVEIIKAAIPASARREGPHPAKRTFQAIRIEVNGELEQIGQAVDEFCDVLLPGGRLCIITFHSLEDRIVKEAFNRRLNPCTCPKEFPVCVCGKVSDAVKVTGKPITAGESELADNPRARSAKLRVIEKTAFFTVLAVGFAMIMLIIITAYSANIRFDINNTIKENNEIMGEIENLQVKIYAANNVDYIESKAKSDLSMVQPKEKNRVYFAAEDMPAEGFADMLKEKAYN